MEGMGKKKGMLRLIRSHAAELGLEYKRMSVTLVCLTMNRQDGSLCTITLVSKILLVHSLIS